MSYGTLWIDEVASPIRSIYMGEGLFHFDVDVTNTHHRIPPGRTLARFHAPDGSLCGIGPFEVPTWPKRVETFTTVSMEVTLKLVGSKPGEDYWETID